MFLLQKGKRGIQRKKWPGLNSNASCKVCKYLKELFGKLAFFNFNNSVKQYDICRIEPKHCFARVFNFKLGCFCCKVPHMHDMDTATSRVESFEFHFHPLKMEEI